MRSWSISSCLFRYHNVGPTSKSRVKIQRADIYDSTERDDYRQFDVDPEEVRSINMWRWLTFDELLLVGSTSLCRLTFPVLTIALSKPPIVRQGKVQEAIVDEDKGNGRLHQQLLGAKSLIGSVSFDRNWGFGRATLKWLTDIHDEDIEEVRSIHW